jgi:hypothetical protein
MDSRSKYIEEVGEQSDKENEKPKEVRKSHEDAHPPKRCKIATTTSHYLDGSKGNSTRAPMIPTSSSFGFFTTNAMKICGAARPYISPYSIN